MAHETQASQMSGRMRWDVFCRVIDNLGDAGVCWRLVRQLVFEQQAIVRLWIDDLAPLTLLCPAVEIDRSVQHIEGIEVRRWPADFPDDAAENGTTGSASWQA